MGYKILFNTFDIKHIETIVNNQCIISYDDYYELYLTTLLELRTKHSHLWKSLLILKLYLLSTKR